VRPSPDVLRPLGPEGERCLEPALAIGPAAGAGASTVLCRARGRAGDAVETVAAGLSRRGWRVIRSKAADPRGVSLALEAEGRVLCLSAEEREREGGVVSVFLGPP
jgi:hypothetical protein